MAPPQQLPAASTTVPEFELVDEGSDLLWQQWSDLVRKEEWTSDDNAVLHITPTFPTTRAVFAKSKADGSFLGCVIWNESDGLAYIGYYLVHPSGRGKGVGTAVWKRAISRIPKDLPIGLRAVPEMAENYKKWDTPLEHGSQYRFYLKCNEMRKLTTSLRTSSDSPLNIKLVSTLTAAEFDQLLAFDKEVTGRDRSSYLRLFFTIPKTEGVVAMNKEGRVVAFSAVTSTCQHEKNYFKFAPLFASSLDVAAQLMSPLVDFSERISPSSKFVLYTLSTTAGKDLKAEIERVFPGIQPQGDPDKTLYSMEFDNPIDISRCFISHNCTVCYDA